MNEWIGFFRTTPVPCPRPRVTKGHAFYPRNYQVFLDSVRLEARSQKPPPTPIKGPFRLTLLLRERGRADLSNLLKGYEDSLQGVVYENDRQATELHVEIPQVWPPAWTGAPAKGVGDLTAIVVVVWT